MLVFYLLNAEVQMFMPDESPAISRMPGYRKWTNNRTNAEKSLNGMLSHQQWQTWPVRTQERVHSLHKKTCTLSTKKLALSPQESMYSLHKKACTPSTRNHALSPRKHALSSIRKSMNLLFRSRKPCLSHHYKKFSVWHRAGDWEGCGICISSALCFSNLWVTALVLRMLSTYSQAHMVLHYTKGVRFWTRCSNNLHPAGGSSAFCGPRTNDGATELWVRPI